MWRKLKSQIRLKNMLKIRHSLPLKSRSFIRAPECIASSLLVSRSSAVNTRWASTPVGSDQNPRRTTENSDGNTGNVPLVPSQNNMMYFTGSPCGVWVFLKPPASPRAASGAVLTATWVPELTLQLILEPRTLCCRYYLNQPEHRWLLLFFFYPFLLFCCCKFRFCRSRRINCSKTWPIRQITCWLFWCFCLFWLFFSA